MLKRMLAVSVVVLLAGLVAPGATVSPSEVVFAAPAYQAGTHAPIPVNSTAWVTGTDGLGLRVHADHALNAHQIGSIVEGAPVRVLEGPIPHDGLPWYLVSAAPLAIAGWVDGQALTAMAPPPRDPTPLAAGRPAWVAGTGGVRLRVHAAPALASAVAGALDPNAEVQVLEGPVIADGYHWFRVSGSGLVHGGWAAGQYLALAPA